jgi:mediator of replication checkpoint protein 1
MASSRESSPASESGSTSPAQLTPNSKIKAMLAALDDESDDESLSGSARRRLVSSLAKKNELSKPDLFSKNVELEGDGNAPGKEQIGSESDEEEDIVRPKGCMAARMMADQSNSGAVEPARDNARERVRKMLPTKSSTPGTASNAEDGDGGDESDVPAVSRKRKIRPPRRATPESSPAKSPGSPSLFVSPQIRKSGSPPPGNASDSDDLPKDPASNERFLALVKKKREERLAKDAELAKEKAKKAAERKRNSALLEEDDDLDDSDENVERRLTQQDRPARKASKKALEEMHRETQRLSRNQQLAHNAITKKKFVKAGFFEKFNYRPGQQVKKEIPRPNSSSSTAPHSDIEMKDTPPTSPASHESDAEKPVVNQSLVKTEEQENDEEIPSLEEALQRMPSSPPMRLDKGKGKAIDEALAAPEESKKPMFTQRPVRIRLPKVSDRKSTMANDSDSDLEIVSAKAPALKKKLDSMFDRVPVKQAKEHSFHTLRMLAHVTSPGKQHFGKNKKPSMTPTGMQVSLQQLARQQAAREKEEKLEVLRAKGIIIQTAEEREMEIAEVEDLVAKARREGEEIMKREKAEAKKERKDNGEADPLGESSDEDWEEDRQELDEELFVSGSEDEDEKQSGDDASGEEEDEENEEDEMALDGEDHATTNPLFDNEAAESEEDEDEDDLPVNEEMAEDGDVDEDDEEQLPLKQKTRRARKSNVISDDEEDDDVNMQSPSVARTDSPLQLQTESPVAPNSVLRSGTKTFIPGVTVAGPAGLGLTQIFAGTMDDSQIASFEPSQTPSTPESPQMDSKQASLGFLRRLAVPELPPFIPTMEEDTQDTNMDSQSQLSHVPESQPMDSMTQGIQLNFSQSQVHEFDSLVQDSQLSPFPEATQDVGFQNMTPIRGRFVDAPPSTVDTIILKATDVPETMEETPIVKKGKLRRRAQVAAFSDEEAGEPVEANIEGDKFEINESVFDVMRKASKKKVVVDEFDKKKSKAKEMVNEQAEESEDEYAGLGGASDDESGGEPDEFVKEMIDDEGGKDVDESKLAAFFA